MTFSEAKAKALSIIKGHWGEAILVSLIYGCLISFLSSFGIGALLFGSIVLIGYYNTLIEASVKGSYKIDTLFSGLNGNNIGDKLLISLLKNVFLALWSLLFIIPGIIKSYSYMLSELIQQKRPDLSPNECITESRRLMDGHKMNMFVLRLSFIGWDLLCILSFGIGYLFLTPYINQTMIEYINANILEIKTEN